VQGQNEDRRIKSIEISRTGASEQAGDRGKKGKKIFEETGQHNHVIIERKTERLKPGGGGTSYGETESYGDVTASA